MTQPIIILDAGHGGRDPGGGTNSFWIEKALALQITMYQFKRFSELGVPVALTRRDDRTIEPNDRAAIVRNSGAKYCFSNHLNAGGGDGAETIYSIHSDGKLAHEIADEIAKEGQNIRRVFTRKGDSGDDYYFMHRQTGAVETIIVEYGFADSKQDDVEQLRKNWERYAEAAVRAFCKHIGKHYVGPAVQKVEPPAPKPEPKPAPAPAAPKGPDYAGHWAEEQIKEVIAADLMSGRADNVFAPDEPLTRAELAVVISRLLKKIQGGAPQ